MSVKRRTYKLLISGFAALVFALQPFAGVAHAATVQSYTDTPFTAAELANWTPDRTTPSGGYSSVSFGGRSDVAELRIDKDLQSTMGAFYHTEGIQRQISASDSIKADLYVDSDWITNSKTVRAGLWGVGKNSVGAIVSYPILEFTTDGFTGWRAWDSPSGTWVSLAAAYAADNWYTLEVVHNDATNEFDYKLDGTTVYSQDDENSTSLGAVILNSKNYGAATQSYNVHWSNFATGVTTVEPEVTAQDFGTWDNTADGFKAITAGFGLVDFDEVDNITVTLSNDNGDIVTNTATPEMIAKLNAEDWTQFSSPFVIDGTLNDTYCDGSACWTSPAHVWTTADKPNKVTATVTGKNAAGQTFTKSASNTTLTESPAFEDLVPPTPVTPTVPGQGAGTGTTGQVASTSTTTPAADDYTYYGTDDTQTPTETLGTVDNKSDDQKQDDKQSQPEAKQSNGLAWYWWLLAILAAAGAGWWFYNTRRNQNDA
jgi:hypothetical protein